MAKPSSLDVIQRLRRERAIRLIEEKGFEPKSFTSSKASKAAEKPAAAEKSGAAAFEFGTSAESAASAAASALIFNEGLCHPSLFPPQAEREERWIKYLLNLRKQIRIQNKMETRAGN